MPPGELAPIVPSNPPARRPRAGVRDGRDQAAAARDPAAVIVLATELGPIHAAAVAEGVLALELRTTDKAFRASVTARTERRLIAVGDPATPAGARTILGALEHAIHAHLGGRPGALEAVPIALEGISEWDRRVLAGVRGIPWGTTVSYGEVARRIGAPGAARAVGSAVGRNPVDLLVPCHRVIAGDGTLGGYGGSWFGDREELLRLKEALLAREGVVVRRR